MKGFVLVTLAVLFATMAKAGPVHRIVGGRPAIQGEAPYQLMLYSRDNPLCGASLVEVDGIQIALTAGHCITMSQIPFYDLVAGDINLDDVTGVEQKRHVEKVFMNRNFSPSTMRSDIAILLLDSPFELNENVQIVPLPVSGQETTQGNLKVSGWGRLEYEGTASRDLQIVEIPLVNDTYCQQAYQDYHLGVIESMICAGQPAGDIISPCNGDSGGPALSDDGYLAGIVSFGHECGHPDYPAVFTEVSYFVDWIHETVQSSRNSQ